MGIDDLLNDSGGDGDGDSSSTKDKYTQSKSLDRTTNSRGNSKWNTKIDFSTAYVLVARDRHGEVHVHKDTVGIKDEDDHWLRFDDDFRRTCPSCSYSTDDMTRLKSHLRDSHGITDWDEDDIISKTEREYSKQYEMLFRQQSETGWLTFCNLCQKQLDEDPNEVIENDPARLVELNERVYYPPKSKPDATSTCQVCGAKATDNSCSILQIRLKDHSRVHVCASHTVGEMAEEGMLQ